MRKHIIGLMVATLATLAIPVAAASANSGDYIAGIGENNPTTGNPNYFAFFAHSNTGGANPFGFVGFAGPAGTFPLQHIIVGQVTCLKVAGNEASAIVKIGFSTSLPPAVVGGGMIIDVKDNGPTVNGQPVDQIHSGEFPASEWANHQTCPDPTDPGTQPLLHGDIVVHQGS